MKRAPLTALALSFCLLGLLASACADGSDAVDPAPGGAAAAGQAGQQPGPGAAGRGQAGSGNAGSGQAGSGQAGGAGKAGSGGHIDQPGEVDKGESLRVVQLITGAPALDIALGGSPLWTSLEWPSATPAKGAAGGLALTASLDGKTLLTGTPTLAAKGVTQVALVGLVEGPNKLISLPPSTDGTAMVRVVHGAGKVPTCTMRVYNDLGASPDTLSLSFGQAGGWMRFPQLATSGQINHLSAECADRYANFAFPGLTAQPITIYLTSTPDNDLFAYAVGEDGVVLRSDLPPTGTKLRFSHFASGIGPVSFTLNNAPIAGLAPSMSWGDSTDYLLADPQNATVRAIDSSGKVVASVTIEVKKLAEMSFALVGDASSPILLAGCDGWTQLKQGSATNAQLQIIDARPKGTAPLRLLSSAQGKDWTLLNATSSPSTSTGWFNTPETSVLPGLDLDQDGVVDFRYPIQFFNVQSFLNLTYAPDAAGLPWLWAQWPGGPATRSLSLEHTANLRLWNLQKDPLALSSTEAPLISGTWPDSIAPGYSTYPVALVRGESTVQVGDQSLKVKLAAMTDTTLIAMPEGNVIEVPTTAQSISLAETVPRLRVINTSGETLSASIGGQPLFNALGPGETSPELIMPSQAPLVQFTGQSGTPLSFQINSFYNYGTALAVYGGSPSWPSLNVLPSQESFPQLVHAAEVTTQIRVLAVLPAWQDLGLTVDDNPTVISDPQNMWSELPDTAFGLASPVDIEAGLHTLHLGHGADQIDVAATLEPGKQAVVVVLPDRSVQVLSLDPQSEEVTIVNASQSHKPASILSGLNHKNPSSSLADALPFGQWTSAAYPGGSFYASVDWDLDGKPEWQSYLPIQSGSFILVVGSSSAGGVVCVKAGWAGLLGAAFKLQN